MPCARRPAELFLPRPKLGKRRSRPRSHEEHSLTAAEDLIDAQAEQHRRDRPGRVSRAQGPRLRIDGSGGAGSRHSPVRPLDARRRAGSRRRRTRRASRPGRRAGGTGRSGRRRGAASSVSRAICVSGGPMMQNRSTISSGTNSVSGLPTLSVLVVVVALPSFDVVGQAPGHRGALAAITGDEVGNVIADHPAEPAALIECVCA